MRIYVEKKTAIIVLVLATVIAAPMAVWQAQSFQMRGEFVRAMKAGRVTQFPPYLVDKVWSDADLATAKVRKIPVSYGRERALSTALYTLGDDSLPSTAYGYQAAVVDTSTGMKYWFGRSRRNPGAWMWAGIHPDSMDRWIKQRGEEAAALEGRRVNPAAP